jgi:hypothetical protein
LLEDIDLTPPGIESVRRSWLKERISTGVILGNREG